MNNAGTIKGNVKSEGEVRGNVSSEGNVQGVVHNSIIKGITPHMGDNGNWFIGDVDTGVKAGGKDGKSAYDIAVAYGFKGTEEDWINSLGSNNKKWVKIDEITFSEDGTPMNITYNNLGGMTEFMFKVEGLTNGTTNSGISVIINGYNIKHQPVPVAKAATNYCYVELKFNGLYWKFVRTGASNGSTNYGVAAEQTPYNIEVVDGLAPANTLSLMQNGVYYAKAGKLTIYGR